MSSLKGMIPKLYEVSISKFSNRMSLMTDFWQSIGVDALNQADCDALVSRLRPNIPRARAGQGFVST